jgi:hypothetical protein
MAKPCGTVFVNGESIRVLARDGESCEDARKRVLASHSDVSSAVRPADFLPKRNEAAEFTKPED